MSRPYEIDPVFIEKLFIHIYCDLGHRTEAKDEFRLYHQLNMARLIRQLLIDGTGVFNLANRYHKLPIRFIVPTIGPKPDILDGVPSIYSGKLSDINNFPPGYYFHPYKSGLSGFPPDFLPKRLIPSMLFPMAIHAKRERSF